MCVFICVTIVYMWALKTDNNNNASVVVNLQNVIAVCECVYVCVREKE